MLVSTASQVGQLAACHEPPRAIAPTPSLLDHADLTCLTRLSVRYVGNVILPEGRYLHGLRELVVALCEFLDKVRSVRAA